MDKIREKFEKYEKECNGLKEGFVNQIDANLIHKGHRAHGFYAGYKAADLLPTEKVCPECEGSGTKNILENNKPTGWFEGCDKCHSIGKIQIYYTPEQYGKITGKPYPDDSFVFTPSNMHYLGWKILTYRDTLDRELTTILIVQTAQPAPDADYRPEE